MVFIPSAKALRWTVLQSQDHSVDHDFAEQSKTKQASASWDSSGGKYMVLDLKGDGHIVA